MLIPAGVEDCTNQSLELVNHFENMSKTVVDFKDRLEDFCKQEAEKGLWKGKGIIANPLSQRMSFFKSFFFRLFLN